MKRIALLAVLLFSCRPIPAEEDAQQYAAALHPGLTAKYASCVTHNTCAGSHYQCSVILSDGSTVRVTCDWNEQGCVQLLAETPEK